VALVFLTTLAACSQPVKPVPPAPIAPAPTAPLAPPPVVTSGDEGTPELSLAKEEAFIADASKSSGMPADEIRSWLAQARYQQSIINAITRPAEGKAWKDYRPIFLTDTRIQ